jgi:hypothetical protein
MELPLVAHLDCPAIATLADYSHELSIPVWRNCGEPKSYQMFGEDIRSESVSLSKG